MKRYNKSKFNYALKQSKVRFRVAAFTLIELLVVIAIIGILSGLIITTMSGATESARIAKLKVYSNSVRDILGANLISEWNFDELSAATEGASIKDSWGGNTGTLYTGTDGLNKFKAGTECVSGNCLYFDGSNDYINCGNNVSLGSNSFTFSVWAKTSRNNSVQTAVQRTVGITGYELQIQLPRASTANALFIVTTSSYPTGFVYRYVDPNNSNSNTTDNKWHQYVGVCDRSQHKAPDIYFDGVLSGGSYYGYCDQVIDNIPAGAFTIGGTASYFQGYIDDVRVYGAAISAMQIRENYLAGLNKLLANNGITEAEYNQRMVELNQSVAQD